MQFTLKELKTIVHALEVARMEIEKDLPSLEDTNIVLFRQQREACENMQALLDKLQ
jgi:exonuclease VII small subunit